MQGGRDVELVVVAGPLCGVVHVARIADADHFGPEEVGALELRGVRERAVEYGRVDGRGNLVEDAGAGAVDEQSDPLREVGVGRDVDRCEA